MQVLVQLMTLPRWPCADKRYDVGRPSLLRVVTRVGALALPQPAGLRFLHVVLGRELKSGMLRGCRGMHGTVDWVRWAWMEKVGLSEAQFCLACAALLDPSNSEPCTGHLPLGPRHLIGTSFCVST